MTLAAWSGSSLPHHNKIHLRKANKREAGLQLLIYSGTIMNFDKHAQTAKAFLRKLAAKLGDEQDISKASGILRSTLHVLRNQSTTEESLQLISQLPMFIKAVYVDGWKPGSNKGRVHHLNDFVLAVHKKNIELGHDEFADDKGIFYAIEAVFQIIREYVSDGEIEDFRRTLPEELHILIEN